MWKVTCDSSERIFFDVKCICQYLTQPEGVDTKIKKGKYSVADIFQRVKCKMYLSQNQREFLKSLSDFHLSLYVKLSEDWGSPEVIFTNLFT